jgi:TRAP-type C4-dicarboxylate transport system substrate-binding protein
MAHGTRLLIRRLVPLALVVSVPLSACGAWASVDKQGAPVPAVTELSLGAADPQDGELRYFVDAVDQLSDHRVRVRVDSATYDSETPGGEAALTAAVRAGTVELGYVPSRDLAADGAPAFVALHSPLLLGETSAAVAVAESPLARDVLSSLDDRGLHGLGLVPLESRRLFSRQPILGLGDLKGARVRINDSAQSASLISAWSGIPVQGYQAEQTKADLAAGGLGAVESSPSYAVTNAYFGPAPYLSSFGLFPKLEALVANPQVWDRLTADDRAALESAAAQTLARAATETARQEAEALSQLCTRAVVVVRPSDAAWGALSAAAAQAQPGDAQATAWTVRLREFLKTAGASASASPSDCTVATDAASARQAHSNAGPPSPSSSAAVSPFPAGMYTTAVTREQWKAANVTSNLATADVTFTSTFGADGTFTQSLDPALPGQGPFEGTWKVTGDRLDLDYHLVASPSERYVETVTWSYLRGDLRFVVVDVLDTSSTVIYQQPWRKVG